MATKVVYWRDALVGVSAGCLLILLAQAIFNFAMPARHWFEYGEIVVGDATTGVSPPLRLERTVRRPFLGHWYATINRIGDDGRHGVVCFREGFRDYTKAQEIVTDTTINGVLRQLGRTSCPRFQPGRYVLSLTMQIQPNSLQPKIARVMSNEFTIYDVPTP